MNDKRALLEGLTLIMIFSVSRNRGGEVLPTCEMEGSLIGRQFYIVDMPGMPSRKARLLNIHQKKSA